jgi:selenocysteine-specific elongation factor
MVGQCAALNVPQWDYKTIKRGCCVTDGGYFTPRQWFLCTLRVLAGVKSPLKHGANIKFHTGTSEVVATVYLLQDNNITDGDESIIQVRLNESIVAGPRDRFILRSLSPVQTVGGGMIIEAISRKLKRNRPEVLQDAHERAEAVRSDVDFVEYAISTEDSFAASKAELSFRTKILPEHLNGILKELTKSGKILDFDSKLYVHRDMLVDMQQRVLDIVGDFHQKKPESPGLSIEQLYEASGLRRDVFDGLFKKLIADGRLVEKKHRIALPEHRESFSDHEHELIRNVESLFSERLFNPPTQQEIVDCTKATPDEIQRIVKILIEQERLVRIDKDLFFHHDAIEKARNILVSYITEQGGLESVKFKYLLDTTRKFAIPLLDYFDRINLTRRVGYTRYLRTPSVK